MLGGRFVPFQTPFRGLALGVVGVSVLLSRVYTASPALDVIPPVSELR